MSTEKNTHEEQQVGKPKKDETLEVAGAKVATSTLENNMSISGPYSQDREWNMDDIIPPELKAARELMPKDDEGEDQAQVQDDYQDEAEISLQEYHDEQIPKQTKQEDVQVLDQDKQEAKDTDEEDTQSGEEDLDLSDESFEKFLEGDDDALTAKRELEKKIEAGEEKFWKADPEYKKMVSRLPFGGVRVNELDKFIQDTLDKRVVDNSSLVQGLEEEKSKLESEKEAYESEINRLRQIERSTRFDALPETQENYAKPMQQAAANITQIFQTEGISGVSLHDLLLAKDRAAFNSMLQDHDISDDSKQKLVNNWKDYRKLLFDYNTDKQEAQQNLNKFLKTNIEPETATKILRNSLVNILENNDKYQDLKEAVNEDLSKHPELSKVVETARNSFMNFVAALGDPSIAVHDSNWMNKFAEFLYDAHYNQHKVNQFQQLQEEHQATQDKLRRAVKELKKIRQAGKGITGERGSLTKMKRNGDAAPDETKRAQADFEALLHNQKGIEDLLPGLK